MQPKLRVFEAFSGIGTQLRGIWNTGLFSVESVGVSEIDHNALLSYAAIHCGLTPALVDSFAWYPSRGIMAEQLCSANIGYDFEQGKPYNWHSPRLPDKQLRKYWLAHKLSGNVGDISKLDTLPAMDLLTFSFPCQDISKAGKQKGLGEGTRSGLVWEIVRLLTRAKQRQELPKFLLLENVKNLVSKQNIDAFNALNDIFRQLGYNAYWHILNAEDCGIPQNRERVFGMYIRQDIDTKQFSFPKPFGTPLSMQHFLDPPETVVEHYKMTAEKLDRFLCNTPTLDMRKRILGTCHYSNNIHKCTRELVYNTCCSAPTLLASMYKVAPFVLVLRDTKTRPRQFSFPPELSKFYQHISLRIEGYEPIAEELDICAEDILVYRLTPRACWRLMGMTDEDIEKCIALGTADALLRKQAGNGIVTTCISLIMEHLYKAQYNNTYICTDESINNGHDDFAVMLNSV